MGSRLDSSPFCSISRICLVAWMPSKTWSPSAQARSPHRNQAHRHVQIHEHDRNIVA
jgi:hypothetical protein